MRGYKLDDKNWSSLDFVTVCLEVAEHVPAQLEIESHQYLV
jgi:hypothetical protein